MKLLLLTYILFFELNFISSCIHSENIECSCINDVIECSGSGENSTEIQQLFLNISSVHPSEHLDSLVLNMTDLNFPHDLSFTNLKIKNLSLIRGLQGLKDDFFGEAWSYLQFLSIEDNDIEVFENQPFSMLQNLTELHLDSNKISEIKSEIFLNLSALEFLSVSQNQLKAVDEEFLLHLPHLQILELNYNNISSLSDIRAASSSLTKLSVRDCNMQGYIEEDSLSGLSHLTYIDLSLNKIKGIHTHTLSSLPNIEILNVSKNVIESLDEHAFSKMVKLEVLDLSRNEISLIKTTAFSKLINLKHLDLSGNKLRAMLCDYTFDLHALEHVDLRDNRIKTINAGTFLYSSHIQKLFLEGNALTEADAVICSPLPNITITFIDVDFQSKNCDMPEPCGHLLSEKEDEEYEDYDTSSTVISTTVKLTSEIGSTIPTDITEKGKTDDDRVISSTKVESITSSTENMTENNETDNSSVISSSDPVVTTKLVLTTFSPFTITHSTITEGTKNTDGSTSSSEKLTTAIYTTVVPSSKIETTHITKEDTTLDDYYDYDADHTSSFHTTIRSTEDTRKPVITESTSASIKVIPPTISLLNYTYTDNKLCLKWKIMGTISDDVACSLRYASSKGRQSKHLVCPRSDNVFDECIAISDIFEFCLMLYTGDIRANKSCFTVHLPKPTTESPSTTFSSSTIVSQNMTFSSSPTTLAVASTVKPTIPSPKVVPTIKNRIPFKVTLFDVVFNESNSALALWGVNSYQDISECNLTLTLTSANALIQEKVFYCSNYSYRVQYYETLNNVQEICLSSHHKKYGTETKCKHSLDILYGASASKKERGYENYSLIAISILLLALFAVIMLVVIRNLLKKQRVKDRYNVYIEEQNVQKRVSSLNQEPNVRYSYIPKE